MKQLTLPLTLILSGAIAACSSAPKDDGSPSSNPTPMPVAKEKNVEAPETTPQPDEAPASQPEAPANESESTDKITTENKNPQAQESASQPTTGVKKNVKTSINIQSPFKAEHVILSELSTVERPAQPVKSDAPIGPYWWGSSKGYSDSIIDSTVLNTNKALGVDLARQEGLDGAGVVVAVLDTGITNTEEFEDRIIDTQGPGVEGLDHADAVASIIAGKDNGLAPKAQIIDAKHNMFSNSIDALVTAVSEKAPIINFSGTRTRTLADSSEKSESTGEWTARAYSTAIHQNGALIVQSTGNDGTEYPTADALAFKYDPAIAKGLIFVTAVNSKADPTLGKYNNGEVWANACGIASDHCMAAPGFISLPVTQNTARILGGTSYAAPRVTGAAALIKQKYPWASNDVLRTILLTTADDLGDKQKYGWGLLNVASAIKGPKQLPFGELQTDVSEGVYSFENNISGSGSLKKTGVGTLNLDGSNTFTGGAFVEQGKLNINKLFTGQTLVEKQGVLGGEGLAYQVVAKDGGTVDFQDGLGIGTLTLGSESTTKLRYGRQANIYGDAKLNGTVEISSISEHIKNNIPKTIQSAIKIGGAREGEFKTVSSPLMYTPSVSYTDNGVDVSMARQTAASVASTLSQGAEHDTAILSGAKNVDALLQNASDDTMGMLAGELGDVYSTTSAQELQQQMYSFGDSVYGNHLNAASLSTAVNMHSLQEQLRSNTENQKIGEQDGLSLFASTNLSSNKLEPHAKVASDGSNVNTAIGGTWTQSNTSFGWLIAQGDSTWSERFNGLKVGQSESKNIGLSATAHKNFGGISIGGGIAGYKINSTVSRTILNSNGPVEASGKQHSKLLQANIYADKQVDTHYGSLGFNLGLRLDHLKAGSIKEQSASLLALDNDGLKATTPVVTAALRAQRNFGGKYLDYANAGFGLEVDYFDRKGSDGSWRVDKARATAQASVGIKIGGAGSLNIGIKHKQSDISHETQGSAALNFRF